MSGVVVAGDGTSGTSASQLNGPWEVFVNEEGTLYVADCSNHRIQRWDNGASSDVTVAGTGYAGVSLSNLFFPTGIVVDSNGYMYIVDSGNNRILRWPPNSNSGECIVACTGHRGNGIDMLDESTVMAFDSYESLFISDGNNNRVQKFQILHGFDETSTTMSSSTTATVSTSIAAITTTMSTSTIAITTTMSSSTTAITTADHTTSLHASSKSSRTHSPTISISIGIL
ncbi:unnamed protein product, partial [Rotaria sordida]